MNASLSMLALALTGCGGSKLPTHTIDVGPHRVTVEVAQTPDARSRGLMHRDSLGADRGMLFVYPGEKPRSFWMKDTRIPLAIAFADRNGTIKKIKHMKPFDTTSVKSLYPAHFALEMNDGWFAEHGVKAGDTLGSLPELAPE